MSVPFIQEGLIPSDLLHSLRIKAWDRFQEVGLPSRKSEAFKYVPLAKIYAHEFSLIDNYSLDKKSFSSFLLEDHDHLVFVNGALRLDLSNFSPDLEIVSLDQAMSSFAMFLQNRLTKSLKEDTDPFSLLNFIFHKQGAFLFLPSNVNPEKPLQIVNLTIGLEPGPFVSMPRVQGVIGKGSSLNITITSHHIGEYAHHWSIPVIDIVQEENSHLKVVDVIQDPVENWYFGSYHYYLKRNASLKTVDLGSGTKVTRRDYQVTLEEPYANAKTYGLNYLTQKNQSHTHVLMKHLAESCTSSQLFKTILDDEAVSSFEGKIYVHSKAQKTESYQLNKNLVLNEKAKAHSKPNLEIFADDVKASHGATIGQLSLEDLFYMQSRGVALQEAKKLCVQGFLAEILEEVDVLTLKKSYPVM
ncbi:MAG: SufD family Fe-S cluster assembly protein [Chlamydiota bacterium]|jgi:Fe-S cluster assembly protein SufD